MHDCPLESNLPGRTKRSGIKHSKTMMPNRRYAPKKATDSAEAHNRTVRFDET